MTTADLMQAIARLRRTQPRNPDTLLVCDELEKRLVGIVEPAVAVKPEGPDFDRKTYMREYMRQWRKARKDQQKGASADAEDVHHR